MKKEEKEEEIELLSEKEEIGVERKRDTGMNSRYFQLANDKGDKARKSCHVPNLCPAVKRIARTFLRLKILGSEGRAHRYTRVHVNT